MAEAKENPDEVCRKRNGYWHKEKIKSEKLPTKVQNTSITRDEVTYRIEKGRDHHNGRDTKSDSIFQKTSEIEEKTKEQTCENNELEAPRSRPAEIRRRSVNSCHNKNNERIAIGKEKKHKRVSAKSHPQLPQSHSSVHEATFLRDEPSTSKAEVKNSPLKKKVIYTHHGPEGKRSAREQEKVKKQKRWPKDCSNTHLPGAEEAVKNTMSSGSVECEVFKTNLKGIPTSKRGKSQPSNDHSKLDSHSTSNIENGISKEKSKDRVSIKVKKKQIIHQTRGARAKPSTKVTQPGVAQEGHSNVEQMRSVPESETAKVPLTRKTQEEKAVSQIIDERKAVTSTVTQPGVEQERKPDTSRATRDVCTAKDNADKVKSENSRKIAKRARRQKKIKGKVLNRQIFPQLFFL